MKRFKTDLKEVKKNLTNENGKVIFENVPKDQLVLLMAAKNNEKEYQIEIQEYYNEKTIRLFSL